MPDRISSLRGAPEPVTSFVGREREIASIREALPSTRLLTLTGAGGIGKTRLALEVARQLTADAHIAGAWVELAAVRDHALIGEAVLATLGLRDVSDLAPVDRLLAVLGDDPFLLVLDNAEHLVAGCAALIDALLRRAAGLRVLVTSRTALGVAGETAWLVPPLSVPSPDATDLSTSEAAQLFLQRAQAASSTFAHATTDIASLVQICRRLDGLPLALELAAARLRALTPRQVAERLDDRFRLLTTGNRSALPRHQTLRAAIDWSYDLLDTDARRLLDRLSVFGGSFTLEDAEVVCAGDGLPLEAILDTLAALIDQSLVLVLDIDGAARYRLLETVREYAAERLATSGDAHARAAAHLACFMSLVEATALGLRTAARPAALARLVPETENFRQALTWSRDHDVAAHLRLVARLHWFWFSTGQWPEARQWLQGALERVGDDTPVAVRAALLFSAGGIAALQAECCPSGRGQLEEAVRLATSAGETALAADATNYLGMALNQAGDAGAEAVLLAGREAMRRANDLYALRLNYLLQSVALATRGLASEAVHAAEEGVRVARAFGLDRELAIALQQLATMVGAGAAGRRRSLALLGESLERLQRDPSLLFTSRALEMVASCIVPEGAVEDAARLYGAAAAIRDAIGARMWRVDEPFHATAIHDATEQLGPSAYAARVAEGRTLDRPAAVELALALASRFGAAHADEQTLEPVPVASVPRQHAPDATTDAAALQVWTLGPMRVSVHASAPARWGQAKARELLVYLLLHPEGRTREQVGAALWPEATSAQLRNNFHVAVHYLRRSLAQPDWVRFDGGRYRLEVPGGMWIDAVEFERGMVSSLRAAKQGKRPIKELQEVLALFTGDFLDGESAGDWHLEWRDRLARLYEDGLDALATALLESGEAGVAIGVLERLIGRDPLHERAVRALMTARARGGDLDGVRRDWRRLEAVLQREGVGAPGRETAMLYRRLLERAAK